MEGRNLQTETLEDRIYEAAVLPERWKDLLGELSGLTGTDGGILMGFEISNPINGRGICSHSFDAMWDFFTKEGWGERNNRFPAGMANGSAYEPRFITEHDIFPDESYLDDPFYRDLLVPHGLGASVGTVVSVIDGNVLIVTLESDRRRGLAERSTVDMLDSLRPHLARSAYVANQLAFQHARTAVLTLEGLGMPAAAVSGAGRVIVENALFSGVERPYSIGLGERLELHDRAAHELLIEALGAQHDMVPVRSIALRDQQAYTREVLHVIPLRLGALDLFTSAVAIVVLSQPRGIKVMRPKVVQSLFDLTPREAQIAIRIARGETLASIASGDHRSAHTVRNQLKTVMRKLGCARQADLARLLSDLTLGNSKAD